MNTKAVDKKYRLVEFHDNDKKSEIMHIGSDEYPKGWSSISLGFDSINELIQYVEMPEKPCTICGSSFSAKYSIDVKTRMLERHMCFKCNFWQDIVEGQTDRCLRIGGVHYVVGSESSGRSEFKGFSGRKFRIRMLGDGREFETTNLWHQGDIPSHFQKLMPDNAEFLQP